MGAPLMVPEQMIPPDLVSRKPSRNMSEDVLQEFKIKQPLIERFNAWRTTLQPDLPQNATSGYQPVDLKHALETVIEQQMAWITAWRIGRF
ncbi:T6SS phospholipase effector Tle1-like catalytic domain-containing protein, partial [Klebsiella pneumoniae]|uniref:T6SS phospholipase effector Tle1-like catalytic domain-containing protein n=1 Tax=Klebsiella pneumoniae TaxID=573 RepID=UPI00406AB5BB